MTLARQDEGQIDVRQDNLPVYDNPSEVVKRSSQWASALMAAVEKQEMFANTGNGKKYLEVEAWLFLAEFAGAYSIAQEPTPIENKDGEITGYKCVAVLYQNNNIISQGTMTCGLDAFPCRGKQGSEKTKQRCLQHRPGLSLSPSRTNTDTLQSWPDLREPVQTR